MTSSRRRLLSAMHLGGLTFREVCLRTWTKINEHEILTRAAAISFYALAALVPFLALVIALSAWFLLSGTIFKHGRKTTDVLFIDASREFQDEKRQARLRSSDIDKIVATFAKYKSVPKYAYRTTAKEIAGNDYNLNIPRYVETSKPGPRSGNTSRNWGCKVKHGHERRTVMNSILLKGVIRHGRVEVDEPINLPEGTEVVVTTEAATSDNDGPMPPEEIARVLAAMQKLQPLEIPDDVAADLDAWERKLNQHGIDNGDKGIEDVFR